MKLNHNGIDSMIRRVNGLSDAQWNSLILETELGLQINNTSFMIELIRVCLTNQSYTHILKCLGINQKTFEQVISESNMEHAQFRFFRYFCPENIRNGLSHSGLPFAKLVKTGQSSYQWISSAKITLNNYSSWICEHGFELGDTLSINLIGFNDIETIEIKSDNKSWMPYIRKSSANFGNIMWNIKQLISMNRG